MKVRLIDLQKKISLNKTKLKGMTRKILKYQGRNDVELSIVLADDSKMRLLNRKFRKIDRSTDVLAFSMGEGEDSEINPALLGDVVVSLEAAERCAKRLNIAKEKEIERYLTHGILHLLGYDHQRKRERKAMREREEEILEILR